MKQLHFIWRYIDLRRNIMQDATTQSELHAHHNNADRRKQAELMRDHLERMGVIVTSAHYTGDSSYPTEYTLTHGNIIATGPTLDLALFAFVEKLLAEKKRREGPSLPPQEPQEPATRYEGRK
jgi:hypothetical protein